MHMQHAVCSMCRVYEYGIYLRELGARVDTGKRAEGRLAARQRHAQVELRQCVERAEEVVLHRGAAAQAAVYHLATQVARPVTGEERAEVAGHEGGGGVGDNARWQRRWRWSLQQAPQLTRQKVVGEVHHTEGKLKALHCAPVQPIRNKPGVVHQEVDPRDAAAHLASELHDAP